MQKQLIKWLLCVSGLLSLGLGIAGIFIPLLPTIPFLLLSAFCFFRSSKKHYYWLMHHKTLGHYLRNYITYRAIPLSTKIGTLTILWITIGTTACIFVNVWWLRIMLFSIAVGVSIHILMLRTLDLKTPKKKETEPPGQS